MEGGWGGGSGGDGGKRVEGMEEGGGSGRGGDGGRRVEGMEWRGGGWREGVNKAASVTNRSAFLQLHTFHSTCSSTEHGLGHIPRSIHAISPSQVQGELCVVAHACTHIHPPHARSAYMGWACTCGVV